MYAYNFKFNTDSNLGEYWGNGVTVRRNVEMVDGVERVTEDVMESAEATIWPIKSG